jgi:hypothetical protein
LDHQIRRSNQDELCPEKQLRAEDISRTRPAMKERRIKMKISQEKKAVLYPLKPFTPFPPPA